jgi:hypothetical protein
MPVRVGPFKKKKIAIVSKFGGGVDDGILWLSSLNKNPLRLHLM